MRFQFNDGGRSRYFKGTTGDCVVRALAICTGKDYKTIYDELFELTGESPRNGVSIRKREVRYDYFPRQGLHWTPTMKIGRGCEVHLREDELPDGRLICSCSRHVVAVIDGVIHDTYDSSRDGTRCVYGYWRLDPLLNPHD